MTALTFYYKHTTSLYGCSTVFIYTYGHPKQPKKSKLFYDLSAVCTCTTYEIKFTRKADFGNERMIKEAALDSPNMSL